MDTSPALKQRVSPTNQDLAPRLAVANVIDPNNKTIARDDVPGVCIVGSSFMVIK